VKTDRVPDSTLCNNAAWRRGFHLPPTMGLIASSELLETAESRIEIVDLLLSWAMRRWQSDCQGWTSSIIALMWWRSPDVVFGRHTTLLIAKLDRLACNVAFVANLIDAGVDFVACDQPFASRLAVTLSWLSLPSRVAGDSTRL
jgi:hypothetical protein